MYEHVVAIRPRLRLAYRYRFQKPTFQPSTGILARAMWLVAVYEYGFVVRFFGLK